MNFPEARQGQSYHCVAEHSREGCGSKFAPLSLCSMVVLLCGNLIGEQSSDVCEAHYWLSMIF